MIRLDLEVNEVNAILTILAERPYKEVYSLLTKVQQQAHTQFQQQEYKQQQLKQQQQQIPTSTVENS